MPKSSPATVAEYLAALPADRRTELSIVRDLVVENLPAGYVETIAWGMIAYEIPLALYPKTYNRKPLAFAALAAQKNYLSLYLNCVYQSPDLDARLTAAFADAGKKADRGKGCIRFKAASELPLAGIGKIIAAVPVTAFIAQYEAARREQGT